MLKTKSYLFIITAILCINHPNAAGQPDSNTIEAFPSTNETQEQRHKQDVQNQSQQKTSDKQSSQKSTPLDSSRAGAEKLKKAESGHTQQDENPMKSIAEKEKEKEDYIKKYQK